MLLQPLSSPRKCTLWLHAGRGLGQPGTRDQILPLAGQGQGSDLVLLHCPFLGLQLYCRIMVKSETDKQKQPSLGFQSGTSESLLGIH